MKHLILLLSLFCAGLQTGATQTTLEAPSAAEALTPDSLILQQPRWSPDGTKIAAAGNGYRGLWVMDADGSNLRQLSEDRGAGYGFAWSHDSQRIAIRVYEYMKRRRSQVIKLVSISTGENHVLTKLSGAGSGLPVWTQTDAHILVEGRRDMQVLKVRANGLSAAPDTAESSVFYNAREALIFANQQGEIVRRLKPLKGTYLNAELSPNGTYIAFELYGGNLHVVKRDGAELTDLGPGERPQWAPDSKRLTYMITVDDGHQILNSDIYVIDIDGSDKQNLTGTTTKIEMNPDWSPNEDVIVFDEMKSGQIYKITF